MDLPPLDTTGIRPGRCVLVSPLIIYGKRWKSLSTKGIHQSFTRFTCFFSNHHFWSLSQFLQLFDDFFQIYIYIYIVIEFVCLPRLHTQLFPGCIPMFIDCSCLLITSFQLFFPYCYLITINDIHGLYHIYDHPKKRVPTASAHVLGKIT